MPLDGRRVLKKSDVMIEDGVICAAGGNVDTEDAEILELNGVIMPGLVDAHAHLEQALLDKHFVPHLDPRVYQDVQLAAWWNAVDEPAAQLMAQVALGRALLSGTTTTVDAGTGKHRGAVLDVATRIGARVVLGVDAANGALDDQLSILSERAASDDRCFVTPAIWCGDAERAPRRVLKAAADAGRGKFPVITHLGTLPNDRGGVRRFDGADLLTEKASFAHGQGSGLLGGKAIDLIADRGGSVVLTPGFDVVSGAPTAPLDELIARDVNLALGAESGAIRTGFDLFCEVRMLRRLLLGRVDRPASRALEIATRGGARALGLPVGSIEVGQRADLILVDVSPEEGEGHEEVARRIVDHGGPDLVRSVWVDGRTVVHNGRLLDGTIPTTDAQEQLRARLGFSVEEQARSPTSVLRQLGDWLGRRQRQRAGWHGGRLPFGK